MKKLTLLTGVAIGYVLGTRAGRERYEQIVSGAKRFAGNPTVHSAASKAQETVASQAPTVAGAVKDKVSSAASAASEKMHRNDAPGSASGTGQAGTYADQPTVRP